MLDQPLRSQVMIGRSRERASVSSLIEQVKQGHGRVLLLSSEAGIGKSRLLAEGKQLVSGHGFLVLECACFPADRSSPYAPVFDLLTSSEIYDLRSRATPGLDSLAGDLAGLFRCLVEHAPGEAASRLVEPEQEKRRLFAALSQFIVGLTTEQPVLLAVEDLHWSDEASLELLHHLARRSAHHPLLLALTYRQDEMHTGLRHWLAQLDHDHLAHEVVLTPLTRHEVEAMLQAILHQKQTVPTETLGVLYELTEGNPFFLEEVVRSLALTRTAGPAEVLLALQSPTELQIPRTIQDAVQRRLARIGEVARQVVTVGAIAGRRFDFALLQEITQHDEQELLAMMKELIAAQLVVEESAERFAFRHALTREAIYREWARKPLPSGGG